MSALGHSRRFSDVYDIRDMSGLPPIADELAHRAKDAERCIEQRQDNEYNSGN